MTRAIVARIRARKALYPERYCSDPKCLRNIVATGYRCPDHPRKAGTK